MRPHQRTAIRPDGIDYWVHERPPWPLTWLLALQHVCFLGAFLTLPLVLGRAAGLTADAEADLIAVTMFTAGLGVMLQALNRYGIGIGFLSPMNTSGVAFPAALAAVKLGGLGLAFGMMSVAAAVQIAASRLMPRLRGFFPVEIAGLTVMMLGIGLGKVGLENLLAIDTPMQGQPAAIWVGVFTLSLIVAMNVWTKGRVHAFSVFAGLVGGQMAAIATGLVTSQSLAGITQAEVFALPALGQFGWSLDWRLIPDFVIVGLALSFNCFGVLTVVQRTNDSGWSRPDMPGIGRGLLAEGLTNLFGSFANGVAQTASGGAAGLAVASGVTSRVVAFAIGGLFFALAFFPPVAAIWTALATPVIGAALLFVASFITLTGIKVTTSRLIDNRKTIVLGLSMIAGLGHGTLHGTLHDLPAALVPVFATSLSVTILMAVVLNALFRIGIHRTETRTIRLDDQWAEEVSRLIWHLGHRWGASRDVVRRLDQATNELHDVLAGHGLVTGDPVVEVKARFDEYHCELRVSYTGTPLALSATRPTPERMLDDPDALLAMAGYLINQMADRVRCETVSGRTTITLSFNDD